MGDNSFLKISGIKKSFGSGENRTEVLRGILLYEDAKDDRRYR